MARLHSSHQLMLVVDQRLQKLWEVSLETQGALAVAQGRPRMLANPKIGHCHLQQTT
jgi:hypothetical protein